MCAGIGSEIAPPALATAPVKAEPRIVIRLGQQNIGVGFVVSKYDVVRRTMTLDQILFQQQSFCFTAGHGDSNIANLLHHGHGFRCQSGGTKIAANPVFKITGLADIEHLTGLIQHLVDARPTGQGLKKALVVELRRDGLHGFCQEC